MENLDIKAYLSQLTLFKSIAQAEMEQISGAAEVVQFKSEQTIINEGDLADALYVIISGSVQVFTIDKEGETIVLARLDEGAHFGEQAYINNYVRTASIKSLTELQCIKVAYDAIDKIFKRSDQFRKYLENTSKEQSLQNLEKQIACIDSYERDLFTQKGFFSSTEGVTTKHYRAGDIIFKQGDSSDFVYFISSGSVLLTFDNKTNTIPINKNQMFGELGVMNQTNRLATATATKETTVVAITAKNFLNAVKKSDKLGALVVAYKNTYALTSNKAIVEEFHGKFNGEDAIILNYKLKNGMIVNCIRVVNQPIFIMKVKEITPDKILTFNKGKLIERSIGLKDNRIVVINCIGEWDELNVLCELLLDEVVLNSIPEESFPNTGIFLALSSDNKYHLNDFICNCMSVTYKTLQDKIKAGCHDVARLSAETGASTACGGCKNKLLDILGQSASKMAIIKLDNIYNDDIVSFTITPLHHVFYEFTPGQYISIKLQIAGRWIERSYTITSINTNVNYYQITVKLFKKGVFSPWLFQEKNNALFAWISSPTGNFTLPTNTQGKLLFFAGGIGITPFIAYLRAMMAQKSNISYHLCYFVRTKRDIALPEDVKQFLAENKHGTAAIYDDESCGQMNAEMIESIVHKYSPDSVFICGPEQFESTITTQLSKMAIKSENIFLERFVPAG